ncbi:hypothetical protein D3C74_131600 [compost metagenome]
MTPLVLLEELKKLFKQTTKNMSFGEGESRRAPQIFIGYPPRPKAEGVPRPAPLSSGKPAPNIQVLPDQPIQLPNPFDQEKIYPLIVVRVLDCVDVEDEQGGHAEVSVRIICGISAVDQDGYRDVLHLTQVVRQTLLSAINIGGAAELKLPLQSTVYEDQIAPYWVSDFDTVFVIPTIIRRFDI